MLFIHILIYPPKLSFFPRSVSYRNACASAYASDARLSCHARASAPSIQGLVRKKSTKNVAEKRSPPGHDQCYASPTPRNRARNPDRVSLCPDYHLPPREQARAGSYSWTREGIHHTEKAYFFGRRSAREFGRTKHKSGLTALQFCLPSGTTSRLARGKTNRSIP